MSDLLCLSPPLSPLLHTRSSGADPGQLARRLRETIGLFAPHVRARHAPLGASARLAHARVRAQHLSVELRDDIVWMRLSIQELGAAVGRAHAHVVYVAYCPRSRAIFVTNVKASLLDIVFHALGSVLSCVCACVFVCDRVRVRLANESARQG